MFRAETYWYVPFLGLVVIVESVGILKLKNDLERSENGLKFGFCWIIG